MIVCLLLALTACTSGSAPRAAPPEPTPSPSTASPSPAASPPTTLAAPLVIAVGDSRGGLGLYAVPPGGHAAVLLHRLNGPAGKVVAAVSLSAGASPTACVVWREEPESTDAPHDLRCYRPGALVGRVVARNAGDAVGVRDDGRALAWTDNGGNENQTLLVADLTGDAASVRSQQKYAPGYPAGAAALESLTQLDWLGPRTLAATSEGQDDEGRGLCVVDLDRPRQHEGIGFGRCLHPASGSGYAHFEQAASLDNGVVVAVERDFSCCSDSGQRASGRAVTLRLSDGAVLGVFATARPGRDVVDVSGGSRAVLYTTAVNYTKQLAVYVRWRGDAHGAPLDGLPADLLLATAQR
jgi:hypothetical protein